MKLRILLVLAFALALGFVAWRFYQQRSDTPKQRGGSSKSHADIAQVQSGGVVNPDKSGLAEMWQRFEISISKKLLDDAIASRDPGRWRPIMGQARHFNVPREKGIALLRNYLTYSDPEVRASAAQYLFELGSREGGPVLVEFLRQAAEGQTVGTDLTNAAAILHQYRYPVDADLIYGAYKKIGGSRLLMYAQLLGSAEAVELARERLRTHGVYDGGLHMAGILKINDPESIAIYQRNFQAEDGLRREMGAVALFNATGEQKYLDYLIAVAEASVDLRPRGNLIDHSNSGREAMMVLQQVVTPQTTAELRKLEAAARKNRHGMEASKALLGLYYFHQDYDYVDSLIMAQFTGKLPEGLLIGSIWDLAAARNKPEIEAAAKAYNREAYEREFLRKAGRPVESWIFQYIPPYIPSYVRPPLTG
jgi:hypothetical protein